MKFDGRICAGLTRRVRGDGARRLTRRALLLAVAAWPALGWMGMARGQTAARDNKTVRVGILTAVRAANSTTGLNSNVRQFVDTMRELGWVEGRNIAYERAFAEGDEKRLPAMAVDLVSRRPDVIYVNSNAEILAALAATRTIPVVFASANSPVENGLIKSFAQPGGNATGVAAVGPETGGKRMQLLKEVLPKALRVGVLRSRTSTRELELIQRAAGPDIRLIPATANSTAELGAAFALFAENRAEAVLCAQVAFLIPQRHVLVALAMKQRIPLVGYRSEMVEAGALMSYNSSLLEQRRRAAQIVDMVLKGARPADIPVELPTKFELVLNRKTAKALGITFPPSVLLQASRVVE